MILLAVIFASVLWSMIGALLWYRNYNDERSLHKKLTLLFVGGPLIWFFLILFAIVVVFDVVFESFEDWIRK
jgi:flagellar biosynthesis protein FlhB